MALDGFRAGSEVELRLLVGARRACERAVLTVFRRHRLMELPILLGYAPPTRYEIATLPEPGPAAARYQQWLGKTFPQIVWVLATLTTTVRWV